MARPATSERGSRGGRGGRRDRRGTTGVRTMTLIRALDRFLGFCERAFLLLANGCLALMLVANMLNMAVRAAFDTSFVQIWPWTMLLFVWSIYLGFYVLYRRSKDVSVNFLVSRLAPAARHRVQLLVQFLIIAFMAVMVAGTWQYLPLQAGVLELVGLPRWVQTVPLLASCLLILLNALVQAADLMVRGNTPRPRAAGSA